MTVFLELAWLIPFLPLVGFAIITLTPARHNKLLSAWLATGLMVVATVVALGVGLAVAQGAEAAPHGAEEAAESVFAFPAPSIVQTFRWAPTGGDDALTMGYYIDPMVAAMLVMVTIASTCIHLFSIGYMAEDRRQARFFSFISLFTAAMLLMVIASNLLLLFMAWEIMGLCSYLLIGFWYDKNYADPKQITPRAAAIKAFITTRIGDVLLMVGLAYLWTRAGSLDFGAEPGQIFDPALLADTTAMTYISLLIFAGTVGKSAQFPLHVWLPDAMEGPTPVSALIHAATMVAAGVFLVARTFPIFEAGNALPLVAAIGAITALGAGLVAVCQFDIKRILAYSTLSQLGFMVAALGVGGWVAALFHLITHAFFKALLFLGSGSIIHSMESVVGHDSNTAQDIRNMGGLRTYMPTTFWTYTIGALALAGIPPLAGFWSKDEILADAFGHGQYVIWGVLTLAAFLTAFYMTRQVVLVFFGEFRGNDVRRTTNDERRTTGDEHAEPFPAEDNEKLTIAGLQAHAMEHKEAAPHESPAVMTLPLVILALLAVVAGFFNHPISGLPGYHFLAEFTGQEPVTFSVLTAAIALVLALVGIGLGWLMYQRAFATAQELDPLEKIAPAAFAALNSRLGFDQLYARTLGVATTWFAETWDMFDRLVLDRIVTGAGAVSQFFGRLNFIIDDFLLNDGADKLADGTVEGGNGVRRIETGKIQDYVALVFGGVVVIGVLMLYVFQ
jgi:NADH-quinone oxidoreductase subunit L